MVDGGPTEERALAALDPDALLADAAALVQNPSVTGDERAVVSPGYHRVPAIEHTQRRDRVKVLRRTAQMLAARSGDSANRGVQTIGEQVHAPALRGDNRTCGRGIAQAGFAIAHRRTVRSELHQ